MKLLLIGGYRFVGRAVIAGAQARGWSVSAFNRGSVAALPGVEQITGGRDDPSILRGRAFDAVIDTSGYIPRHVRATAELLRDVVQRYCFVSSISAYVEGTKNIDESSPLQPPGGDADPDVYDPNRYGDLKVLCEAAAESAMPGRTIAVRAGFIVGPYDNTDRFNSWIERAARDRPFLVPGAPDAPQQMVDVRDLAVWMLDAVEHQRSGPYNVTGPIGGMTTLDVARACIDGTGSHAKLAVVPSDVVLAAGIEPWKHIPFWIEPDDYWIMQARIDRALAAGLRTRPLVDTVRDTYAWLQSSDHERRVTLPLELEEAALR
jgi:2'-hydroxyisoflavone reductase